MNLYDLWFSSVRLSDGLKIKIIKKFKDTQDAWINLIYSNRHINIDNKIYKKLKKSWDREKLERCAEECYRKRIRSVSFNENTYPYRLKNYGDSPAVLFYKGDINKLNDGLSVGVVGSRKCSVYGKSISEILGRSGAENGVNVISGMARGIDSHAHKGCLASEGYTCAVLGSGVDVVYPRENFELYGKIAEEGCIVSEFLPGTGPMAYNFPKRNRIISGLSDVVVVVEAAERSGALITANMAAEQGKTVMAVPGSVFSLQSKGSNKLIKDGAYPLTCVGDLFELLDMEYSIKTGIRDNKEDTLTLYEKKVYDVIGDTPLYIDDISRITNIDIKQLYELLFELQLKNLIMCLSGNYYVKIRDEKNIINNM